MRTLAIDTAGREGGVALLEGDVLLAGAELPAGAQAERLPGAIEQLLDEREWTPSRLELVAVSLGPGGFTGVRIGMAAAQGITFGLDIPLVGVSSLEILAGWAAEVTEGTGGLYVALQDARRGEFYVAAWRRAGAERVSIMAPTAVPVAELRSALAPHLEEIDGFLVLCGDGVPLAAPDLVLWPEPRRTVNPPRPVDAATILGRLGAAAFRREGAPPLLEPLYIRPPDARRPPRAPGPSAGPAEGR